MLNRIFLSICNMTLTGCFVIVFILFARLLLKRLPRVYSYILWAVAGLRLLCPFSFEAKKTLIPLKAEVITPDLFIEETPGLDSGIVILDEAVNAVITPATPVLVETAANPAQMRISLLACLWLLGLAVFVGYNLINLALLRRRLRDAEALAADCFVSSRIDTPFVLGLIRPRIYLPATLNEDERALILLHERKHIRRRDPLVKLIGFAVLALHWFNPLVWVAFRGFERDMEISCDESVTAEMNDERRADYSMLLLSLSIGRRPAAPHLAFGESDTGARIKHVLSFKRPAIWICIIALVAVVVFGAAMLFSPAADDMVDQGPPVTGDVAVTTEPSQTTAQNDGIPPRRTPQPGKGEQIALSEKIQVVVYDEVSAEGNQVMFSVSVDGGVSWNAVTRAMIPTYTVTGYYTRPFSTQTRYDSTGGDVISFSLSGDTLIMTLADDIRDMIRLVYHSTDGGLGWKLADAISQWPPQEDYNDAILVKRPLTVDGIDLSLPMPQSWSFNGLSLRRENTDLGSVTVDKINWDDRMTNDYNAIFTGYLDRTDGATWSNGFRRIYDNDGKTGVMLTTYRKANGDEYPAILAYLRDAKSLYRVIIVYESGLFNEDTLQKIAESTVVQKAPPVFIKQRIVFPAYTLRDNLHESWHIAPFVLTLPLPEGWTVREPSADEKANAFGTPLYLYDGDTQVGTLSYSTATWLEEGKGDPMMYFQGYTMGSVVSWGNDLEMVKDGMFYGTAVTTKSVNQLDGPAAAASTVKYYPAMLCYLRNGDTLYQVGIEFAEDAFERDVLRQMANATSLEFAEATPSGRVLSRYSFNFTSNENLNLQFAASLPENWAINNSGTLYAGKPVAGAMLHINEWESDEQFECLLNGTSLSGNWSDNATVVYDDQNTGVLVTPTVRGYDGKSTPVPGIAAYVRQGNKLYTLCYVFPGANFTEEDMLAIGNTVKMTLVK